MSLQAKILDRGPTWAKAGLVLAGGFYFSRSRFGSEYRVCRAELAGLDALSPGEALDWQREKIRKMLATAIREVAFYRERAAELPDPTNPDADPFELLRQFPVISRSEYTQNSSAMLRQNPPHDIAWHKTSGTTGQPLHFAMPKSLRWARNFAHVYRWYERFGFRRGDRRVTLGGRYLGASPKGEVYRNPFEQQLLLGVHTLGTASVDRYLSAMRKFSPKMLQGHPSAIAKLVSLGREHGIGFPRIPLVFTTGETLFDEDREAIASAFGAQVISMYGHGEMCFMACECSAGSGFHVDPFLGYVELLPHASGMKEVVVTSFHNDVMPFIRYRTGDLVGDWVRNGACSCGLWYPRFDSVHGRVDDAVLAMDGSRIAPVQIRTSISSCVSDAPAYRITQHRDFGSYTLAVYATEEKARSKADEIAGRLRDILGVGAVIAIEFLSIETLHHAAGKHKMVVSEGAWTNAPSHGSSKKMP